jgi:hypothetical protein
MQLAHSVAFGQQVASDNDKIPRIFYDAITPLAAGVESAQWEAEADRSEARIKERKFASETWEDLM